MALTTDFLVLGSGIAGLTFALRAAEFGEVLLVTKRECDDSATNWAQGGMAAVLAPGDSFEKHKEDTHFAGAGLCHEKVVDICVREAPESIRWLSEVGTRFSRSESGDFELGREAAHHVAHHHLSGTGGDELGGDAAAVDWRGAPAGRQR